MLVKFVIQTDTYTLAEEVHRSHRSEKRLAPKGKPLRRDGASGEPKTTLKRHGIDAHLFEDRLPHLHKHLRKTLNSNTPGVSPLE